MPLHTSSKTCFALRPISWSINSSLEVVALLCIDQKVLNKKEVGA